MSEENPDAEIFMFLANMHALTALHDWNAIRNNSINIVKLYAACGADLNRFYIYNPADIPAHAQLNRVFSCLTIMWTMERMHSYKEALAKWNAGTISVGTFNYPILMAADILMYDADVVPVGIDQKQHVELARNIAERFNHKYGETFKIPEPVISKHGAKIYDLQNPTVKMSKSTDNDKGCIILLEDPEVARKKIMSAVTDSDTVVKYDVENKPGISNLLTIYSSLKDISIEEAEKEFAFKNYGEFKKCVADVVVSFLEELQEKYRYFISSDMIDKLLDESNHKVRDIASKKVREVFDKVGVGRWFI